MSNFEIGILLERLRADLRKRSTELGHASADDETRRFYSTRASAYTSAAMKLESLIRKIAKEG